MPKSRPPPDPVPAAGAGPHTGPPPARPIREARHEPVGWARRGVASIQQRVHDDVLSARLRRELGNRNGMPIDRVNPAWPEQANQMEATPWRGRPVTRRQQGLVVEEASVVDCLVDAWQVLDDRLPGAQVEMSHLAVPHLATGQAHSPARRVQFGARPLLERAPPVRHARLGYGVVGWAAANAKAIDDDQDERPWSPGAGEFRAQ